MNRMLLASILIHRDMILQTWNPCLLSRLTRMTLTFAGNVKKSGSKDMMLLHLEEIQRRKANFANSNVFLKISISHHIFNIKMAFYSKLRVKITVFSFILSHTFFCCLKIQITSIFSVKNCCSDPCQSHIFNQLILLTSCHCCCS